jgi:branched-chain amino acid transport system substrate-binding protein
MVLRGAELRIAELNAAAEGIRQYKLLRGDDQASANVAVTVAQDFATNPKIPIVIGHFNSSCTLAAQRIYEEAKLPNVSYGSTNDDVGRLSIWTFRTPYKNILQGETLARYAAAGNLRRIAIIAENEEYGRGLANSFKTAAARHGLKIIREKTYDKTTADFRPLLIAIRATRPDAVLLAGFYPQLQVAAVQAREIRLDAPFLAGDGVGSSMDFIKNAGPAAEGTVATGPFLIENERPSVHAFQSRFKQQYGEEPDSWAVYAYDAIGLADHVLRSAGPNREAVRQALAAIDSPQRAYPGLVRPIWFDKDGDAVNDDVSLAVVRNGKYVVIDRTLPR